MGLPTNTTTYVDIKPATIGAAKVKMLDVGQHILVTERFGQVDPLRKNSGLVQQWARYNTFPRATAPLAEGIPPTGRKTTVTRIYATLEYYGDVYRLTNIIQNHHSDPVLDQMTNRAGQAAAETIEEVRLNVLKAGTNVSYASGATSRATVNSPPTVGDLRKAYRYLKNHKAREFTSLIKPGPEYNTEPVMPSYYGLGHTSLYSDIKDMRGFKPVENYASQKDVVPGEVGAVEGFRIVLTSMVEPWTAAGASGTEFLSGGNTVTTAASCDVFPLLLIAENAYAIVPFSGQESVDMGIVNPGKKSVGNELGQIGFVSWQIPQACAITNQAWMIRLECAATAEPN